MADDERQCRLCLQHGDSDENRLFSPCQCNGSMAYIHEACLEQWRQSAPNRKNYWECPVCNYKYQLRRVPLYRAIVHWLLLLLLTALTVTGTFVCVAYGVRLGAYAIEPTALGLTEGDSLTTVTPECFIVAFLIIGLIAFVVGFVGDVIILDHIPTTGDPQLLCILMAVAGVCYFTYRAFVKLRVKLRQVQRHAGDQVLEVKKRQ
jgi:hypothetical protein